MKISELRELADVVMKPGPAMPRADDPKVKPSLPGTRPVANPLPIAANRSSPMPVRKFSQGGFWKGTLLPLALGAAIGTCITAPIWLGYGFANSDGLNSSQQPTVDSKPAHKSTVSKATGHNAVYFNSKNGELKFYLDELSKEIMNSYVSVVETMQGKLSDNDLLDLYLAVDKDGDRGISVNEADEAFKTAQKKCLGQEKERNCSALEQKVAEKDSKIKEQEKKLAEYVVVLNAKDRNYSALEQKIAEKETKMAQQNQEITALKAESQANIESMKCIIESKDWEMANYENTIMRLEKELGSAKQANTPKTEVTEHLFEVLFSNAYGELKFEYPGHPSDSDKIKAVVTKYLFFCKSMQGELSGKQKLDLFLAMDKDGDFKISLEEAEEVLKAAREKYQSQAKPQQ